jgi:hypothetical protein
MRSRPPLCSGPVDLSRPSQQYAGELEILCMTTGVPGTIRFGLTRVGERGFPVWRPIGKGSPGDGDRAKNLGTGTGRLLLIKLLANDLSRCYLITAISRSSGKLPVW